MKKVKFRTCIYRKNCACFLAFIVPMRLYHTHFKKKPFLGGLHVDMEAVKLAGLLSYRCLGLCVTRCTSPEITHADTP